MSEPHFASKFENENIRPPPHSDDKIYGIDFFYVRQNDGYESSLRDNGQPSDVENEDEIKNTELWLEFYSI